MRLSMTIYLQLQCIHVLYIYILYTYVVRGAFSSLCFQIHCTFKMLLSGPIHAINRTYMVL